MEKERGDKDIAGSSPSQTSLISVPLTVISDRSLATLEAVVEYLKEKHNLSFHQIAELLNRDDRTIWTSYHRAQQKRKSHG